MMLLITNLLKKQLMSSDPFETALALDVLAKVATPDLARDLVPDILALLGAARAVTRKKATMVLFRFFRQYPDAVRPAFKRLTERLEDGDEGVIGAVVSVITELALHDPQSYLPLAPLLYRLLGEVKNTWTTIKIVKLFGLLCPHEPRLGKKLADVLASIIQTTPAVSLQFECIKTATIGVTQNQELIALCVHTLCNRFVGSADANLKYLGLTGLANLLDSHPDAVSSQADTIFGCLDEIDTTIQRRALQLACGMARRATLADTLDRLALHAETAATGFAADVVGAALELGSRDRYALVGDHAHYVRTLARMARSAAPTPAQSETLAAQLVDVSVRFPEARPAAVGAASDLIGDVALLQEVCQGSAEGGGNDRSGRAATLRAAAWLVGEYAPAALASSASPSAVTAAASTLEKLLQPLAGRLPGDVQGAYAYAALKVYAAARVASAQTPPREGESVEMLGAFVGAHARPLWEAARDPETQDRCAVLCAALRLHGPEATAALAALVEDEMNPVSEKAQRKVRVPAGLDLDTALCETVPPPTPLAADSRPPPATDMYSGSGRASPSGYGATAPDATTPPTMRNVGSFYLGQAPPSAEDGSAGAAAAAAAAAGGPQGQPQVPDDATEGKERRKKKHRSRRKVGDEGASGADGGKERRRRRKHREGKGTEATS